MMKILLALMMMAGVVNAQGLRSIDGSLPVITHNDQTQVFESTQTTSAILWVDQSGKLIAEASPIKAEVYINVEGKDYQICKYPTPLVKEVAIKQPDGTYTIEHRVFEFYPCDITTMQVISNAGSRWK